MHHIIVETEQKVRKTHDLCHLNAVGSALLKVLSCSFYEERNVTNSGFGDRVCSVMSTKIILKRQSIPAEGLSWWVLSALTEPSKTHFAIVPRGLLSLPRYTLWVMLSFITYHLIVLIFRLELKHVKQKYTNFFITLSNEVGLKVGLYAEETKWILIMPSPKCIVYHKIKSD
jgi:hypothetical protein